METSLEAVDLVLSVTLIHLDTSMGLHLYLELDTSHVDQEDG